MLIPYIGYRSMVRAGGTVVIGTFAADGPATCSGLPVARYDPDRLASAFGEGFVALPSRRENIERRRTRYSHSRGSCSNETNRLADCTQAGRLTLPAASNPIAGLPPPLRLVAEAGEHVRLLTIRGPVVRLSATVTVKRNRTGRFGMPGTAQVLVVANRTADSDELLAARPTSAQGSISVTLVAPAKWEVIHPHGGSMRAEPLADRHRPAGNRGSRPRASSAIPIRSGRSRTSGTWSGSTR